MDTSANGITPKGMWGPITLRATPTLKWAHAIARLEIQPDLGQQHDRSETDEVIRGSSSGKRPKLAVPS